MFSIFLSSDGSWRLFTITKVKSKNSRDVGLTFVELIYIDTNT
jgi:hypothetical protein